MKNQVVVPDRAKIDAGVRSYVAEARELLEAVCSVEIASVADYAAAAETTAELKARREAVDARRRSWVDPLNVVIRSINAAFKPAIDALEGAERALRDKIVAYSDRQASAHEEAVREIAAAPTQAGRAEAHARLSEAVVPRVEGLALVETWDGEVMDASKLPREYLVPDVRKLLEATRAAGGDPKIPGWRAIRKIGTRVSLPGRQGGGLLDLPSNWNDYTPDRGPQ